MCVSQSNDGLKKTLFKVTHILVSGHIICLSFHRADIGTYVRMTFTRFHCDNNIMLNDRIAISRPLRRCQEFARGLKKSSKMFCKTANKNVFRYKKVA